MITKRQLESYWVENEQKFKDIIQNVPYQKKGIWYTEAFLFCSICDILKVDAIIESGVAYGCSTEIFANYFDFNIIAIDSDQYDIFSDTSKRLEKYNNLSLIKGNSFELIPNIIEENLDANVGIFIDGPKGREARRLRDNLLKFNNISCFGFHDYSGQNRTDIGTFENSFITHDLEFIYNKFNVLNDKVIETVPKNAKRPLGPGVCVEIKI